MHVIAPFCIVQAGLELTYIAQVDLKLMTILLTQLLK